MSRTPEQLADMSWLLVEEALTNGTITLNGKDGEETRKLDTKDIMDVVKWLTAVKLKQKHAVDAPEDFALQSTKDDGSGDYDEED